MQEWRSLQERHRGYADWMHGASVLPGSHPVLTGGKGVESRTDDTEAPKGTFAVSKEIVK